MKSRFYLLFVTICISTQATAWAQNAETVFVNGKIITVNNNGSVEQAIALSKGKIQAVGTNAALQKSIGPNTLVIDLQGKTVIPGAIETHCHSIGVARGSLIQEYQELSSIQEIQDWLKKRAKEIPAGRWIRVPRTDITRLIERRHPTPAELDAGCSTHPVILNAARKNVLNSLGWKTVGLNRDSEKISGGTLIKDDNGELLMAAGGNSFLNGFIPKVEVGEDETFAALQKVHYIYNSVGITSIFERASNRDGYETYKKLQQENKLTVRMTMTFRQQFNSADQIEPYTKKLGLITGEGDDWVNVGPLKITLDGGIHWGSTWLSEPFGERRRKFYVLSDASYQGDQRYSVDLMKRLFSEAHRLGWQMCVHVTGDGGVSAILDALEAIDKKSPVKKHRFTMTHAYFPTAKSVHRSKPLGVCYDTQGFTYFRDAAAISDVYGQTWAERFIGLGEFVKAGVPVAINSDHMIGLDPDHSMNSFNPFLMLYIAVSRKDEQGNVYGAHQKISRMDALRCITSVAAYLSFDEDKKGSLEPGKFADLVILDRDYLTCPEGEIREIKPLMTIVGGKVVFGKL